MLREPKIEPEIKSQFDFLHPPLPIQENVPVQGDFTHLQYGPESAQVMSETLSHFCGSPFWDLNRTWYSEEPSFTECFERTVLASTPCLFLLVFSLCQFWCSSKTKASDIPWNWRNITKIVTCGLLIFICVMDLFITRQKSFNSERVYVVDTATPLLKIVAISVVISLVCLHRRKGVQSSGVLFIFWFLLVLLGLSQLKTSIERIVSDSYKYADISYLLFMGLAIINLILNFISDLPPRYSEYSPENLCPEESASYPSKLLFLWYDPFVYAGYKRTITQADLWALKSDLLVSHVTSLVEKYWKRKTNSDSNSVPGANAIYDKCETSVTFTSTGRKRQNQASIALALWRAFGLKFILVNTMKIPEIALAFSSPQILGLLITFVQGNEPTWRGYLYISALISVAILGTIISGQYFYQLRNLGLQMRCALVSVLYKKSLRLSGAARKDANVGQIVNLMSVDAQSFFALVPEIGCMWAAPFEIALAFYFLWEKLGVAVLAGVGTMAILIPINMFIARYMQKQVELQKKKADQRIKIMSEILSGIKVMKLYAWEPSFEKMVMKIREKEIKIMRKIALLQAGSSFMWCTADLLALLATFTLYVLIDDNNVLDVSTAFVSLSLFRLMNAPLNAFPGFITDIIEVCVSLKRINKFMNSEELDPSSVNHSEKEEDALVMENCTFKWSVEDPPILNNINLRIKPKSLVAIVGAVGTGKSSLLSAFLGEMEKTFGYVNTKGSVAYVPQVAWIQNLTLQDNILYGKPMNKKRYGKVIEACALKQDLEMLPGGDQTEIGEKGINLSGGQKQRVSLARAVYYDSDIYYLDDPLSAVDSHVGKHIFENVIGPKGILHDKTRVFVTHGITYLSHVDLIVVLKDGSISEIGTYSELLDRKGAFAEFLTNNATELDETDLDDMDEELKDKLIKEIPGIDRQISKMSTLSDSSSNNSLNRRRHSSTSKSVNELLHEKQTENKLIEDEKTGEGKVKWGVYLYYLRCIGVCLASTGVIFAIVEEIFIVSSDFWLSVWSSDTDMVVDGVTDTSKRDWYLGIYGLIGSGTVVSVVVRSVSLELGCLEAASKLHFSLLERILRAPIFFFDTTPIGRILNRFTSDVSSVDTRLVWSFTLTLPCLAMMIGTISVVTVTTPFFIILWIPVALMYYFVQKYYVATGRQLKRIESVTKSPIFSHFGETITGASVIRAYNENGRFIGGFQEKVNLNQAAMFASSNSKRWLEIRLELLGQVIVLVAALFAVIKRGTINPGLVGLSITYALQVTRDLNWLLRMMTQLETEIVAVERIKEYEETPQEPPWEKTPCIVGPNWPEEGKVEFRDFKVRYREGLDLVLKGINLTIKGGEKIGIVGRTGAGKSSLTLGLFRIIEAAGGSILIDGVDLSKLGLHVVRSRITIIPQDPVLFSGTLRMNLDPFETYTDDQVWRALELAHLKNYVSGLPAKLQHIVSEGGDNLSVGQRQLICLARALLRKTKVLVLDEATAAVDLETDDLIQRTISTEFAACTVLTIAHRINTIMDSDRVIVLSEGVVVEFDAPDILLRNKTSAFYLMAKDAGLVH